MLTSQNTFIDLENELKFMYDVAPVMTKEKLPFIRGTIEHDGKPRAYGTKGYKYYIDLNLALAQNIAWVGFDVVGRQLKT